MTKLLHRRAFNRLWILPLLVAALVASHGVILYYLSSHLLLSTAVASGVIFLLLITHRGVVSSAGALFRCRSWKQA